MKKITLFSKIIASKIFMSVRNMFNELFAFDKLSKKSKKV